MMTDEERRARRNEASRRSRLKKKGVEGDCSPSLGGDKASTAEDNAPTLGGKAAADHDLMNSVVYLQALQTGWYGYTDEPYLPYPIFVQVHGEKALEEEVTVTVTAYWDSGRPDESRVAKKYKVLPHSEWGQRARDAWQLCTKHLEPLFPEFAAKQQLRRDLERAYAEATTLAKGKTAKVIKGRKVPIGTVGEIIWLGGGEFGDRVGLKDANDEVHWTAASNVKVVVDPDEFVY